MIIGVPKEVKNEEYRVAMTPMAAAVLTQAGHRVLIQAAGGEGSGFSDKEYADAGAKVVNSAKEAYSQADMIYKVKEPISSEYPLLRREQILFTYLHLANELKLTQVLMDGGVTGVAYETVQLADGSLPLLTPMSQIAGRLATQIAAQYLGRMYKGSGKLLGGVPGVLPATVVIIGGGVVGTEAAKVALGMGARVIITDIDVNRLRYLSEVLHGRLETLASNSYNIANAVKEADVVVGAVLVAGGKPPIVVTRDMVKTMKPGSVIVDVAVDQGGCIETTRPTSHSDPVYVVDGVIHYCVTNMPGIVPRTSTQALCNATLPYALRLANQDFVKAIKGDEALAKGVNTFNGHLTNEPVSRALGIPYTPLDRVMGGLSR